MRFLLIGILFMVAFFRTEMAWGVSQVAEGSEKTVLLNGDKSRSVCSGETVTFQAVLTGFAADGYTITWKKVGAADPAGGSGESLALSPVTEAMAGSYYCEVQENNAAEGKGLYYSDTVALTVAHMPVAEILAKPVSAVLGYATTVEAQEEAGATYAWKTDIQAGNERSFTFTANARTDQLTLTVSYVTDGKTCTAQDIANVTLRTPALEGTIRADRPGVCEGGSVTFSLAVIATDDYTVAWRKIGRADTLSEELNALTLSNLTVADSGRYYCEIYDRISATRFCSDTLPFAVYAYPEPQITAPVAGTEPCLGAVVNFTVTDNANLTGTTYRWAVDGVTVPGAAATVPIRVAGDRYKVYVNYHGCESADSIDLNIIRPIAEIPAGISTTIGSEVTVTATLQEGAVYSWSMADEFTQDNNVVKFTATPRTKEVYLSVEYRGCQAKDTTLVGISHADFKVDVKAYGFTRVCEGDSVDLYLTTSERSVYEYYWYEKNDAKNPVSTNMHCILKNVTPAQSGEYYCRVYDVLHDLTFYSDTLNLLVSKYPKIKVDLTPATKVPNGTYCYGDRVTLQISNTQSGLTDLAYHWQGSSFSSVSGDGRTLDVIAKQTTIYRALITNHGCIVEDSVIFRVSRPEAQLPSSLYVIEGEEVTVSTYHAHPEYNHVWGKIGDAPTSSSPSYTFTAPAGRTNVTLEVMDANGCTDRDTCYLVALPALTYVTSVNDGFVESRRPLDIIQTDTILCERQPLTLEIAYTGYEGYTLEWRKKGDDTFSAFGQTLSFDTIRLKNDGAYFCRAWDNDLGDYVYSDTVKVTVNATPIAKITAPDNLSEHCGGIELELQGDGSPFLQWLGSGIISGSTDNICKIRVGTNRVYSLVASSGETGCYDTATITLRPILHTVDIDAQRILSQATQEVSFTAAKPKDGEIKWYVNGAAQTDFSTAADAKLDITHTGSVVVEMVKEGCHYYDTCQILVRTFEPVADLQDAADDGYAMSRPILRVVDRNPVACLHTDVVLAVHYLGYDRYQYEWRKVGQTGDPLSDSIVYVIRNCKTEDEGSYYCRAFNPDNNEYVYSDTLELTITEGPVAAINSVTELDVCYGDEIVLTSSTPYNTTPGATVPATVADRLVWTGEGIISGQGTNELHVRVGEDGLYVLEALKENGCASKDSVRFQIKKVSVEVPEVVYLSKPSPVKFWAKRSNLSANVQWSVNGEDYGAATPDSISINITASGYVKASVWDKGCPASDSCRVYVKHPITFEGGENDGFVQSRPSLRIPSELKNIRVCPDTTLTLTVLEGGYDDYVFKWWKVGVTDPVHVGKDYIIPNLRADHKGFYYCTAVIHDQVGAASSYIYSDTLELVVKQGPLATINATYVEGGAAVAGEEICYDTRLQLDASGSASDAGGFVAYTWTGGEVVSSSADQDKIEVCLRSEATYIVKVTNAMGCSDTAYVHYTVRRPKLDLPAQLHLNKPNNKYVFDVREPDGASVAWNFQPVGGSMQAVSGNQLPLVCDGMVIAATTQDGCTGYDTCYVFVKYPITYGTAEEKDGYEDGFFVLESDTRVWLPDAPEKWICLDDQLVLEARVSGISRYTYKWYRKGDPNPVQDTSSTLIINNMSKEKAGKYYCVVTDIFETDKVSNLNKTYSSDTVDVKVKPGPIARYDFDEGVDKTSWTACFGEAIGITAENTIPTEGDDDNSSYEYSWKGTTVEMTNNQQHIIAHPQGDGIFILTVKDRDGGCSDTAVIRFNMRNPHIEVPRQLDVYEPQHVTITAKPDGEGNIVWYKDRRGVIAAQGNPGVIEMTEDCQVIVSLEQDNCFGFDTTFVYVRQPKVYLGGEDDGFNYTRTNFSAFVDPQNQSVCRGLDIDIKLNIKNDGRILKYEWRKVGETRVLSREQNFHKRATSLSDGGEYFCMLIDPSEKDIRLRSVSSDTATVTILNGPIAKISAPQEGEKICQGITIDLDASATENNKEFERDVYEYEWFGANITYTGIPYIANAYTGGNGQYILKASMDECVTYDTVKVNIYSPEVYLSPTLFLSKEEIVEFSVPNPENNTIRWHMFVRGMEVEDYKTTADTVHYRIWETAKVIVERQVGGCSGYDTCDVFVKDIRQYIGGNDDGFLVTSTKFYAKAPEFTDLVCEGDAATMYVEVVGNDFYRYAWKKVGDESRILSEDALYKIPVTKKGDEGYYFCEITDVNNNVTINSDRVYIAVKELPKAVIEVDDTDLCFGQNVELRVDQTVLKEGIQYAYLWWGNGIQGDTAAVTSFRAEKDGVYRLMVADGDCYSTDTVDLTVKKYRLEIDKIYSVKKGGDITLQGTVNGDSTTLLNWKVNGQPYKGVNPLELMSIQKTMNFTVQTAGKCLVESSGTIYVRNETGYQGGMEDGFTMPNSLPKILDQSELVLGCDVDTATLWVTAVLTEDLKFRWEKFNETFNKFEDLKPTGYGNVSGFEESILKFTSILAVDEGRYRCRLRNQYGYVYTREIRLVKGGTPIIKYRMDDNQLCVDHDIKFNIVVEIPHDGTTTGLHYKWYFSKDGKNFRQQTPERIYDFPNITIENAQETNEGYYMVEASNYCGVAYDTAFQEIWERPTFVKQPEDQRICIRSRVELATEVQGGGIYHYNLYQVELDNNKNITRFVRRIPSPNGTDLEPLRVIDPVSNIDNGDFVWKAWNDCDTVYSRPFRLTVEEEIQPIFEGIDTTVCAGVGGTLVLSAKGNVVTTPTIQYYWEKDGTRLSPEAVNYTIRNVKTSDAGVYTCYAYHSCPARQIKQYNVNTKSRPVVIMPIEDIVKCEGEDAEMKIDYTSDAGPVTCIWVHNGNEMRDVVGHISGTRSQKINFTGLISNDAGSYYVKLQNDCPGVTSSATATVKVNLPPQYTSTGSLANQSAALCLGNSITLSVNARANSNVLTPIIYTWTKNDVVVQSGTSASLQLKNVDYSDAGVYTCNAQNNCSSGPVSTSATIDVITPKVYLLKGAGSYCRNDGREVTLSGFEKDVIYKLYRRSNASSSQYTLVKEVNGNNVPAGGILSFGYMEYGLYHVVAEATSGSKVCTSNMEGEIEIIRNATPEQFDFYVSDPMCEGESSATVSLRSSENDPHIEYVLERFDEILEDWCGYSNVKVGTGQPISWAVGQGAYRVVATNVLTGCDTQIGHNDTVAIRPYPQVLELLAVNGDTTACYDMESDVVLQIESTESSCAYTLMKEGEIAGAKQQGGSTISWSKISGGVYTVQAITNYGCAKDMGRVEVVGLPPLEQYIVSGEKVFCAEEKGNNHFISLEGSTPGIRYDFYTTTSSEPIDTMWGTGDFLPFEVSLLGNETYYVVAVDTHDHCVRRMGNEVQIEENKLSISMPSELTVTISTDVLLEPVIKNAMGNPVLEWRPIERIAEIDTQAYTARTEILTRGGRFMATVSDDYCSQTAYTDISVSGEMLWAEIKQYDCFTDADTMYVCAGEPLDLCSLAGGGGGNFKFQWIDDKGVIANATNAKLENYRKLSSGFIVLHVTSAVLNNEGATVLQQAYDTVHVILRERPQEVKFENAALTCVIPGHAANIVVKDAEDGIVYQLEHRAKVSDKYEAVGGTKTGDGTNLTFPVEYTDATAGFYRVRATRIHNEVNCSDVYTATEMRRQPQKSTIRGEGALDYCEGSRKDSIYVQSTEEGVTYRLIRKRKEDGLTKAAELVSTGGELLFNGTYKTGLYRVVAELGQCRDTMEGQVEITTRSIPYVQENVRGMNAYCMTYLDANTINVKVEHPLASVEYTLYKAGEEAYLGKKYGDISGQTLEFNGLITKESGVGSYYLVARTQGAVSCSDTARGLTLTESPLDVRISRDSLGYCANLEGCEDTLWISGIDTLIHYELRNKPANVGGYTVMGSFGGLQKDSLFYAGTLAVPEGETRADYFVYANVGSCSRDVAQIKINKYDIPIDRNLLGDLIGCAGYDLPMGVASAISGVIYELHRETNEGDEKLETKTGEGKDLRFRSYSQEGTYSVIAINTGNCRVRMNQQYVIRPLPEFYRIYANSNTYCEGDRGVEIGITGTQVGVTYTLQQLSVEGGIPKFINLPATIYGTDSNKNTSSTFSGRYKGGKYRIVSDYCNLPMLDTITINELPLPQERKLAATGMACVDSTMRIFVLDPEANTDYTLCLNGNPTDREILPGSGEVSWGIDQAQDGTYTVRANKAGCLLDMKAKIQPGRVSKLGELQGIIELCYLTEHDLYLKVDEWEENAKYVLHRADTAVTFEGQEVEGRMVFADVPAGFDYYVSAENASCATTKGNYHFPGTPLPEYAVENFKPQDCVPDGKAAILLENLNSDYQYTLTGVAGDSTKIMDFGGDTLVGRLNAGTYTLVVHDTKTNCNSLPLHALIRSSIPDDTIASVLAYCKGDEQQGVHITLSGATLGVEYTITNITRGDIMEGETETVTGRNFFKLYKEGDYEFYRERTGLWGGCSKRDTFHISKYPIPSTKLTVKIPDTLCEIGGSVITIENSQEHVYYMLRDTLTNLFTDTIYGNGGAISFEKRKPAGTYTIEMKYEGLCPASYYKYIRVSPVPPAVLASSCSYCFDTEGAVVDGCSPEVKNLKATAEYVIWNAAGEALDTLYGVNTGYYKELGDGEYTITGTYPDTKCGDVVGSLSVHKTIMPKVFPITNVAEGGDCSGVADIQMRDGCEGDSVQYYVYMNDYYQAAGPYTAVGNIVNFGKFKDPGSYRIKAVKGEAGCEVWMEGTIILYDAPEMANLGVQGIDCGEGSTSDISITAHNCQRNWSYYLMKGEDSSEQQSGKPGNSLTWDKVGGKAIKAGEYILYAINSCDSILAMDTVEVKAAVKPETRKIDVYQEGYYCKTDLGDVPYDIKLTENDKGVTYSLRFGDIHWEVEGTGQGTLLLQSVATAGLYDVYAIVDSTGCTYKMDSIQIKSDDQPQDPGLSGTSKCAVEGDTIWIGVGRGILPWVDYILEVNGVPKDTILGENVSQNKLFAPQSEFGCYRAVAKSVSGYCNNITNDEICLSTAPDKVEVEGGAREVGVCDGDAFDLKILNSQLGVNYFLMKNGKQIGKGVNGNGGVLTVASIREEGSYTVRARVSDECVTDMEGEIKIYIKPRPLLNIVPEYNYSEGGEGVQIEVLPETSNVQYNLYEIVNNSKKWRSFITPRDGQGFIFTDRNTDKWKAGIYVVETTPNAEFSCIATDTVRVNEIVLPKYKLEIIGTPYKCEASECRTLTLNGSDKGTYYTLYRRSGADSTFIVMREGNGKPITFVDQCDTGYYYVLAEKQIDSELTSITKMENEIHIYVPDAIQKFILNGEVTGYCDTARYEENWGSVVLSGSQDDKVTYNLYRDGLLIPNSSKKGTGGGPLRWNKLAGKGCVKNNDEGYTYTVVATDGNCKVEMTGAVDIIKVMGVSIANTTRTPIYACTGEEKQVSVSAYGCLLNYEWKNIERDTIVSREAGFTIDSLRLEDIGTYVCTVSNQCGAVTTEPIEMNIRKVVTMEGLMEDVLVCGDVVDVNLTSKAVGENYAWYREGDTTTIYNKQNYPILGATKEKDEGSYVCKTWNDCGALYDTVRLEFNRVPEVTAAVYHKDTLCKGSSFTIEVQSRDSLVWYRDDRLFSTTERNRYQIDSVTAKDEGLYKVLAINSCTPAGKDFPLVSLYVDDTLYVEQGLDAEKHYCENRNGMDLSISLKGNPSRVSYQWYENGYPYSSGSNVCHIPQVSMSKDQTNYYVEYANKCSNGSFSQMMYVDLASVLEALPEKVMGCAGEEGVQEVIVRDIAQLDAKYNHYEWYRRMNGDSLLVSTTDTLSVPLHLSETGVYYCKVTNECGVKFSTDVRVNIDSIPVITKHPKNVTVCENGTTSVTAEATGGDVSYYWFLQKKDGSAPITTVYSQEDYASSCVWNLNNCSLDFDSCRIWCVVRNVSCNAEAATDTVMMRVIENVKLATDVQTAYLCPNIEGASVKVAVTPQPNNVCNFWDYYVNDELHHVYSSYTDTLVFTRPGVYKIHKFETTGSSCVATASEVIVNVENRNVFSSTIAGEGATTVCRGQKVYMRIRTVGGDAPWKLDIRSRKDNKTSMLFGREPIITYSRDTVVELNMLQSDTLYLASSIQFMDPEACPGSVAGEIQYIIQDAYQTHFTVDLQNLKNFGACDPIDLAGTYVPYPEMGIGKFYVDGQQIEDGLYQGEPGDHLVKYIASTSAGCTDSAVVNIHIDSMPAGRLVIDKNHVCPKETVRLFCYFDGAGPFSYKIRLSAYRGNGTQIGRATTLRGDVDEYGAYNIEYDPQFNEDSLRIYQLTSVTDKYGCVVDYTEPDQSLSVFMRPYATFSVKGQHRDYENNVFTNIDEFLVPKENPTVKFRTYFGGVTRPWSCNIHYIPEEGSINQEEDFKGDNLTGPNFDYSFDKSGMYVFTMADAYCSAETPEIRKISIIDTGYMKVKVILGGAYNQSIHQMESAVFPDLLEKKWAAWPDLKGRQGIDWVRVELRTDSVNGKTFYGNDFLLLSDGTVVDQNGNDALPIPHADFSTPYYVVVKHRNHLTIGYKNTVTLERFTDVAPFVDLTYYGNIYFTTGVFDIHVVLADFYNNETYYGMCPGNVYGNALISAQNPNEGTLKEETSTQGYYLEDVNLDGFITLPPNLKDIGDKDRSDAGLMFNCRNKYSDIKD